MTRNKYQEIIGARKILELPEKATLETIKSNYRRLLSKWHPDKCRENPEICKEMTQKIISAYKIIILLQQLRILFFRRHGQKAPFARAMVA